jgi:uncharacterized RDD family membrane protein YckC
MAVYKFAGFWRRLVAYAIDCFIINIVFIALLLIVVFALFAGTASREDDIRLSALMNQDGLSSLALAIFCFFTVLSTAYFTYFHGINGRTPGKMLLGLQVLSVDGNRISFGISFLRAIGYMVSSIVFCIGFIWAAFDPKKQAWHDKIAATVVVIRPEESKTAGLIIPEPRVAAAAAELPEERKEPGPPEIMPPSANEDGNAGTADQTAAGGQKIP